GGSAHGAINKHSSHSKAEGSARMPQSRRGQQSHRSPPRDPGRHHQGPRPTYHAQTRRRHRRGTRSLPSGREGLNDQSSALAIAGAPRTASEPSPNLVTTLMRTPFARLGSSHGPAFLLT